MIAARPGLLPGEAAVRRHGRVGFVYPRVGVDSVPALTQAIDALAEHGYAVQVFTYDSPDMPPPVFSHASVTVSLLGRLSVSGGGRAAPAMVRGGLFRWLRTPLRWAHQSAIGTGDALKRVRMRRRFRARVRRVHRAAPYACFIGVDADGLELAAAYARPIGVPVLYYSLELLLSEEVRTRSERKAKAREKRLLARAAAVVVQDADRGRLLAADNGIPLDRLVYVPNAPRGPARTCLSDHWHRLFDLPEGTRVVLHTGSLGDWTAIEQIIGSVPTWPEPWVLVIHTRYGAAGSEYVERLRGLADPMRVFFSLNPVARDRYDALVDAADVGIAFYVPAGGSALTGTNVETVGLSSGKIAYALRAGLPVIVNRRASVSAMLQAAGCGVSVEGVHEIGPALAAIDAHYAEYSGRAGRFFDKHLDPRPGLELLAERIDTLVGLTPGKAA